ncbi:MAG: PQQ-binding-like beta-propeller repeat protein [Candidatus Bathyarchaeota archaeon]|uniref:outer membrane protein assembly factor BamB family protein n=1 Tax=Candidatus Bathycorpusculum sp. TaxID=2994959 RepID=UPI00282C81D6|nr:PQQ-binding-like beta-propeller repeat protein [Candidatus Termiticorpusculum sp.]MCL2257161.1 PQQ-binding-like beta-propeller repeat protein [Candidatus Termiticorpusculum sp.]MCL2292535.1 PQQ-binding-like beta-propeller repeat protein [Candidatus Termiticorpusculum sp.]
MNIFKNKAVLSAMAVLMILCFAVSSFALPNANAQSSAATFPFVDAVPTKAGVGQSVLINWGLLNFLQRYNDGWNVTLQITYPDGKVTNTTLKTWSTGTVGKRFTFSEEGNYTLRCVFDGEDYNPGTGTRFYEKSVSEEATLQIIKDYWKPDYPGHSHPAEYWTRPVDAQLREWYDIMGSWVAKPQNLYAPYNEAPESAHVLWSMPIGDAPGGISGGDNGDIPFQGGDAYEGKFADSVIIAGVLYYNKYYAQSPQQAIVAVELRTGNVLWEKTFNFGNSRISRGQILNFISMNNRGSWAYLWIASGTNMFAVDPTNGQLKYNMTNVPAGTIYYGPNGEMLKYAVTNIGTTDSPNWRLTQWNSTHVVVQGLTGQSEAWGTQVTAANGTTTYNATTRGYDLNISVSLTTSPGSVLVAWPGDRVILAPAASATNGIYLTGISLDEENPGYVIYNRRQFPAPSDWSDMNMTLSSIGQMGWAAFSQEDYRAVFWTKENRVNYVFDLNTGKIAWTSQSQIYADAWSDTVTTYGPEKIFAYGKLFEASVGGIVYCYDAAEGELLWTYEATDKYNESYHREAWWLVPLFISDGKLYLGHMVHSPQVPISRGAPFICLDVETHEVVWEIDGAFRQTRWGGRALMGDSVIATYDYYDQNIYAIGKGPSEITVSAPTVAVTAGTKALITGTVMDVSPGTKQDGLQYRFSNGVPAMSDESQSDWMLYVYKGFSLPMTAKGIDITVYAWDSVNAQRIDIGTVTSDTNGQYAITWTPDKAGTYGIYAYFEGTAAFYGDDASTTMAVSAAPEVPPPVETPAYEWYIIGMGIAIIAVVIIIGLLIIKKK